MRSADQRTLFALKVKQWLAHWNSFEYDPDRFRSKPPPAFYMFSIRASDLRALSGVHRRKRDQPGFDPGIQRGHEERRSAEIRRFIHDGFPYSSLTDAQRASKRFDHFRQPGWLATSIVVNILRSDDVRRDVNVDKKDLVTVLETRSGITKIVLPNSFTGTAWEPKKLHPLEIIDGQHRLYAFSGDTDFELPVVAFNGLDIGWQAYLFWTINIKPKKINASLAFDLYPLLRTQDWLDQGDDFGIYRQTRAQELVEALWSVPSSPWYQKINMLGDRGRAYVSQAAWIRSLTAAVIKRSDGKGITIGGLFAGGTSVDPIEWNRQQQSAFLIYFWQEFKRAVHECDSQWAKALRKNEGSKDDPAFYGQHSLINQDQGVRVLLHILNDLCMVSRELYDFDEWYSDDDLDEEMSPVQIAKSIKDLRTFDFAKLVSTMCDALARYDWRSSNAPGLSEDAILRRKTYRGSGGYRELRIDLLAYLAKSSSLKSAATKALAGMRSVAS